MNKLRKILFPFSKKYNHLYNYWWHRFFVVAFFITIVVILIWVFISLNKSEVDPYVNCISLNMYLQKPFDDGCNVFVVHPKMNFLIAFLGALISSYILQLVYYRIIIYVIFGKKTQDK